MSVDEMLAQIDAELRNAGKIGYPLFILLVYIRM